MYTYVPNENLRLLVYLGPKLWLKTKKLDNLEILHKLPLVIFG